MCMIDDAEYVTVLSERERTAAKPHKCAECGRHIQQGEKYRAEVIKDDGSVHTHCTCLHCMAVRGWLSDTCGGWIYTGVEEDAREHVYEGVGGWPLARAVVAMGQQWKRRDGTLRPVPSLQKFAAAVMQSKQEGK